MATIAVIPKWPHIRHTERDLYVADYNDHYSYHTKMAPHLIPKGIDM